MSGERFSFFTFSRCHCLASHPCKNKNAWALVDSLQSTDVLSQLKLETKVGGIYKDDN